MKTFSVQALTKKGELVLKKMLLIDRRKGLLPFVETEQPFIIRFKTTTTQMEKITIAEVEFMIRLVMKANKCCELDYIIMN